MQRCRVIVQKFRFESYTIRLSSVFYRRKKNLNFSAIIANESHMVLILIDLNRFMALPLQKRERERKIVFRKFNLMLLWMRKWCRRSIGVEFFMLPFFCITLHIAEALKFMHEVYLLPFTWCPKSLLEICWFFFCWFFCLLLCLLFFGVKIFVLHYILFFTQKTLL